MTARRQETNHKRRRPAFIALFCGLVAASVAQGATTERLVTDRFTGLAIGGFDPVAYFTDSGPLAGREDFEAARGGAVWRFRNEGNRAVFLAHPEVYSPQFGGYDPIDVGRGVALAGNPKFWLIAGKRLFLFGRPESRDAFAADPVRFARAARQRWPAVRETLAQ